MEGISYRGNLGDNWVTSSLKEKLINPVKVKLGSSL
jgi:hypothetical protein